MAHFLILLTVCSVTLSELGHRASTTRELVKAFPDQPVPSANDDVSASAWQIPIALFTASLAWATLAIQVVVVPFYNKGELLHKDYWGSGKISSTLAAIEAGTLIPSLARMFGLAIRQQPDKRRRPEAEMEALLQSVAFLPDLKAAQEAMSEMDALRQHYSRLKQLASRLWKMGLLHVVATFLLPLSHWVVALLDVPLASIFWIASVFWAISLFSIGWAYFGFHAQIERFNTSLEINAMQDI